MLLHKLKYALCNIFSTPPYTENLYCHLILCMTSGSNQILVTHNRKNITTGLFAIIMLYKPLANIDDILH